MSGKNFNLFSCLGSLAVFVRVYSTSGAMRAASCSTPLMGVQFGFVSRQRHMVSSWRFFLSPPTVGTGKPCFCGESAGLLVREVFFSFRELRTCWEI